MHSPTNKKQHVRTKMMHAVTTGRDQRFFLRATQRIGAGVAGGNEHVSTMVMVMVTVTVMVMVMVMVMVTADDGGDGDGDGDGGGGGDGDGNGGGDGDDSGGHRRGEGSN